MRSKLLKSFIYVFGFWWTAFALWWSVANPDLNYEGLLRLHQLFPRMPLNMPEAPVSVLQAWGMQKQILLFWSVPIVAITGVIAAAGAAVVWLLTWLQNKERLAREAPQGLFRGVSVSLGRLPEPKRTKREILEIGAADSEAFACMSNEEKTLLVDILGIISAHPKAYSGSGIGVPLLEHVVRVVEEALTSKNRPGLSAIVAAAHETGKLTAYVKDAEGEWKRVKNHDREAARHLATLNSWWELPNDVRLAVLFAVKYKQSPTLLPELEDSPHIYKMAKDLLYRAAESTEKVATVAKTRIIEKQELPAVALQGFLDALPTLPFQDGLPKGVKAVGWKVGTRLFLLEMKLRETIMAKLDPDIRGALEGAFKDRNKLAAFTQEFLKALDSKGWLVKEHGNTKMEAKDALWVILAGKFDYKGVIIIDIPKEYSEVLPSKDSLYEITIKGALFPAPANQGVTTNMLADLGVVRQVPLAKEGAPTASASKAETASTSATATPAPQAQTNPIVSQSGRPNSGATRPSAPIAPNPATQAGLPAAAPRTPAPTPAPVRTPTPPSSEAPQGVTTNMLADLGLVRHAPAAKAEIVTTLAATSSVPTTTPVRTLISPLGEAPKGVTTNMLADLGLVRHAPSAKAEVVTALATTSSVTTTTPVQRPTLPGETPQGVTTNMLADLGLVRHAPAAKAEVVTTLAATSPFPTTAAIALPTTGTVGVVDARATPHTEGASPANETGPHETSNMVSGARQDSGAGAVRQPPLLRPAPTGTTASAVVPPNSANNNIRAHSGTTRPAPPRNGGGALPLAAPAPLVETSQSGTSNMPADRGVDRQAPPAKTTAVAAPVVGSASIAPTMATSTSSASPGSATAAAAPVIVNIPDATTSSVALSQKAPATAVAPAPTKATPERTVRASVTPETPPTT